MIAVRAVVAGLMQMSRGEVSTRVSSLDVRRNLLSYVYRPKVMSPKLHLEGGSCSMDAPQQRARSANLSKLLAQGRSAESTLNFLSYPKQTMLSKDTL